VDAPGGGTITLTVDAIFDVCVVCVFEFKHATWYFPFADIPTSCHGLFVAWLPAPSMMTLDDDHDAPEFVDR
jgi:hypothetical protein